jgi:hypothetical protein
MADLRFTPIPVPADVEDGQDAFAVLASGAYLGRVESSGSGRARRWAAYGPAGARVEGWFASRDEAASVLEGRPAPPAPEAAPRPHTAVYVTDAELATLRALAAALGYFTKRGPHAKRRGSVTALNAALARAAGRDLPFTLAVLRGLLGPPEEGG